MTDITILVLIGLVALIGGYVQGCIGFGVGTIAAPIIALADPTLMPFTVLILGVAFSITTTLHDWKSSRWRESTLAFAGRVPGTAAAVAVVVLLPIEILEATIALAILGRRHLADTIPDRSMHNPRWRALNRPPMQNRSKGAGCAAQEDRR